MIFKSLLHQVRSSNIPDSPMGVTGKSAANPCSPPNLGRALTVARAVSATSTHAPMNTQPFRVLLATTTVAVFALAAFARPPAAAPAGSPASMHAPSWPAAPAAHSATRADVVPPTRSAAPAASTGVAVSSSAREIGAQASGAHTAGTPVDHLALVENVRHASFTTRETVAAEISTRLESDQLRLAFLQRRAEKPDDPSRAALARALRDVRAAEKDLRASLRAATKEANESNWGAVQSALARDYSTYARTVIAAEAAAGDSKPGH